ncbi:hypothetical protein VNO77_39342 [Canavalia gladiata]|uniref:Uncharacterized protein n=1 Tax=Canavalia gladiata TaxID=3824 RepID=A0AAN9KAW8_CANGL
MMQRKSKSETHIKPGNECTRKVFFSALLFASLQVAIERAQPSVEKIGIGGELVEKCKGQPLALKTIESLVQKIIFSYPRCIEKFEIQHATVESLKDKSGASSIDPSLLHLDKQRRRTSFDFLTVNLEWEPRISFVDRYTYNFTSALDDAATYDFKDAVHLPETIFVSLFFLRIGLYINICNLEELYKDTCNATVKGKIRFAGFNLVPADRELEHTARLFMCCYLC